VTSMRSVRSDGARYPKVTLPTGIRERVRTARAP
jgi:hypothetical protein